MTHKMPAFGQTFSARARLKPGEPTPLERAVKMNRVAVSAEKRRKARAVEEAAEWIERVKARKLRTT